MYSLLCINVMLDFIWMCVTELWSTGNKQEIQNENKRLNRTSNQWPFAFKPGALDNLATSERW